MAAVGWRMLKRLAVQIPGAQMREVDRLIEFPGGGIVQIRSADNPDSLRGESLDRLVMDEAAFMREEAWTEALRPTLSDRRGRAVFISTPKGRNWFWRAWQLGQGADPDWCSWQFPTTANPHIDPAEVAAARRNLPERIFAQEYLAEFIEDGGGVFRRVMEAAVVEEQPHAIQGHEYVMGVDLARKIDFTVCVVLDISVSPARMVAIDRFNQIDWNIQIQRIRALAERFQVARIMVDQTGVGDPIVQQLQRDLSW
jgi:phage FluMu gp28-like protein